MILLYLYPALAFIVELLILVYLTYMVRKLEDRMDYQEKVNKRVTESIKSLHTSLSTKIDGISNSIE